MLVHNGLNEKTQIQGHLSRRETRKSVQEKCCQL